MGWFEKNIGDPLLTSDQWKRSDKEGRINYILNNYEYSDSAVEQLIPGYTVPKAVLTDDDLDEIRLVFYMVQDDKSTQSEAIKNIARLYVYLQKEGWEHHKPVSTKNALDRYLNNDQNASIIWDQPGFPSVTNWNNIDKYVQNRNLLDDTEMIARFYDWYEKFNIPHNTQKEKQQKEQENLDSNETEETEKSEEKTDSLLDNLINTETKKTAVPIIAIVIIVGIIGSIIYNEKFKTNGNQ